MKLLTAVLMLSLNLIPCTGVAMNTIGRIMLYAHEDTDGCTLANKTIEVVQDDVFVKRNMSLSNEKYMVIQYFQRILSRGKQFSVAQSIDEDGEITYFGERKNYIPYTSELSNKDLKMKRMSPKAAEAKWQEINQYFKEDEGE